MTDPDRTNELLVELIHEVRALRQVVQGGDLEVVPVPPPETVALALEVLDTAFGYSFTSADLCHKASGGWTALHDAIVEAIGVLNPRALGAHFAKWEGHNLGGVVLKRVRNTRDGTLWEITSLE